MSFEKRSPRKSDYSWDESSDTNEVDLSLYASHGDAPWQIEETYNEGDDDRIEEKKAAGAPKGTTDRDPLTSRDAEEYWKQKRKDLKTIAGHLGKYDAGSALQVLQKTKIPHSQSEVDRLADLAAQFQRSQALSATNRPRDEDDTEPPGLLNAIDKPPQKPSALPDDYGDDMEPPGLFNAIDPPPQKPSALPDDYDADMERVDTEMLNATNSPLQKPSALPDDDEVAERTQLLQFLEENPKMLAIYNKQRKRTETEFNDLRKRAKNSDRRAENSQQRSILFEGLMALSDFLGEVVEAVTKVAAQLNYLSSLSQAEGTSSTQREKENPETGKSVESKKPSSKTQSRDIEANVLPVKGGGPPKGMDEVLKNKKSLPLPRLDHLELQELAHISEAYDAFVKEASFLDQPAKLDAYKSIIKESCTELTRRFDQRGVAPRQSHTSKSPRAFYFPGPTAQEVHGHQPLFEVLLRAVCNCAADVTGGAKVEVKGESPLKQKRPEREKWLEGTETRKRRSPDFVISQRRPHLTVVRDDGMELTVEIKPFQRTDGSVWKMWQEARDQALSHAAKNLSQAFNFQGVGVDSHATAVYGCLGGIEIIKLRLENSGRQDCQLVLQSTGPLPLMSPEAFDLWVGSENKKKKKGGWREKMNCHRNAGQQVDEAGLRDEGTEVFKKKLFEQYDANNQVPDGFKALYALVRMSRKHLFGPDWSDAQAPELGDYIGSGTFADVFVYEGSQHHAGCVVKLSRHGRREAIKNELEVLMALGAQDNIPTLLPGKQGETTITIGDVDFDVPSVILSPQGRSLTALLYAFHSNNNEFKERLKQIGRGVCAALEYIHSKGYVHNDISDGNIVLLPGRNVRPILVDFGIACRQTPNQECFLGTPEFVSRKVHMFQGSWTPSFENDMTSLAYTMAILANVGIVPAQTFPHGQMANRDATEVFEARWKFTTEKLGSFDDAEITGWCSWIDDMPIDATRHWTAQHSASSSTFRKKSR